MRHIGRLAAAAAATALAVGCAAPTSIPAGRWAGQGTFVDYEAVTDGGPGSAVRQRVRDHRYETSLDIAKTQAFGREAWKLAILSKRGKLFNVTGEETKLTMLLVKMQLLPNGSMLLALVEPPKDKPKAAQTLPEATVGSATAIQTPRGLVLQIDYFGSDTKERGCFVDTIRFEAGRVAKAGTYVATAAVGSGRRLARVNWVEQLRPLVVAP